MTKKVKKRSKKGQKRGQKTEKSKKTLLFASGGRNTGKKEKNMKKHEKSG